MWLLIALFVLLFFLLLLSMPLIVEARVRVGVRGAAVRAKVYLFGLVPIPLRLRVSLFAKPYFTLQFLKKRVPLLKRKRNGGEIGILKGVRLIRVDSFTTVGITDDPAHAVLLAGAGAVLLSMLTARFAERGSAGARLSREPMARWTVSIRALVFPLDALLGFCRARRIARAKAANNSRKSNEKRTNDASC